MSGPEEFPALEQFLGGYFHQDWGLDFSDPESLIHSFLERAEEEFVQDVIHDLESVLAVPRGEAEMKDLLFRRLGCYVEPSAFGQTYTQFAWWLRDVLRRGISG